MRRLLTVSALGLMIAIGEAVAQPPDLATRWAEFNAAVIQAYREGQYNKGATLAEQALTLARQAFGPRHPNTLASVSNLALLYQSQGRYGDAEPLYAETLQLSREVLGPRHPNTLTSMNNLAALYQSQGRYGDAEPLLAEALQLSREVLGPRHPNTLTSMNNLAFLYQSQGRYGDAEPLYAEALQLRREVLGPRHPDTLGGMTNLAFLYQRQGRYGEAEPLLAEALQLRREVLGPRHPNTLGGMTNLAVLYLNQGRYGEAEPLLAEALQLRREVLGPRHPDTLASVNNLAMLYQSQGRYGEAEPLLAEALQLSRAVLGPRHPNTLTSMNNLAMLYRDQGRYGEAEPLFAEALQFRRAVLGPRHPNTLTSMNTLGALYESQGRYGDAEPLFAEALQLRREVLGLAHPATLLVQLNGVTNLAALGQGRAAVRQLAAMEPQLLTWLGAELYSNEAPSVRSHLVASQATYQDVAISLALRPDATAEAAETAASAVLRFKGLQAEEEAYLAGIVRRGADPQAKSLAQEITGLRARLATLYHGSGGQPEQTEQLRRDLNARELSLGRVSRRYQRHLQVRNANLRDLQRALPDHTALLEIRQYRPVSFAPTTFGNPRWAGLLVTGDSIRVLDLGQVTGTAEQAAVILRDVDGATGRTAAQALHAQLLGPLGDYSAGLNRLFIAPDGALHLVPFGALLNAAGRRLAERLDVRLLETGRDLLRPEADRPGKGLIALGGIDFGPRPAPRAPTPAVASGPALDGIILAQAAAETTAQQRAADTLRAGFGPLDASKQEIEEIGKQYRVHRRDEPVELWIENDAGEARLKALPRPPRVLHLATHGFYLAAERPQDRPMLLAGVALTGANRALRGAGEDGILYAIEAQGLNLEGTELVVLSACETAQGQIDYAEGVSGLVRAFRTAGARYVLVALRPVADQGASAFMQRFYHHWFEQARSDPAAALRAAQASAITAAKQDTTWAYFTLVGG